MIYHYNQPEGGMDELVCPKRICVGRFALLGAALPRANPVADPTSRL